ncbi:MAG: PTS sugar transporter subunit IIA [Mariprofundaceae bacterium]
MIGMVLIGHEHIASQMLAAVEHVVEKQPLTAVLDVSGDDNPDALRQQLDVLIRSCDVGDGVLLLADMFGGTPCNVAIAALRPGKVEVVSGFNLPLLIKAATLRQSLNDLSALAHQVVEAGRQYMCLPSHLMDENAQQDCAPAEGDRTDA